MPETIQLKSAPREGDVVLLVGTAKGAFVFRSDQKREQWEMAGPFLPGHKVYSLAYDGRGGRSRVFASTFNNHWGVVISHSDDFGKTWRVPEEVNVKLPEGSGQAVKQVWEIVTGGEGEPDALYAGIEPATLFKSRDGGETWSVVDGLYNHPHRAQWQPGGGGLCLHTIVPHPTDAQRMWIAVSTGGVYYTGDGGQTWAPHNKGVSAVFVPGEPPEFGQCVHRVVRHPSTPEQMFLQNHWGLFRTDDGAKTWVDIGKGFPWTFGFAMAVHPHEPATAYILPMESDMFRCTPEGKLRVYRTRDAGGSWEALTNGLPQEGALETVLRHGMDTDTCASAGIYFGTESGKVYGSRDSGESWELIREGLPPVMRVKAVVV